MTVLIERRTIPSYDVRGAGALGRHVNHDSRSRGYAYATAGLTLQTVTHTRRIAVHDQGSVGSCTANAAVGVLGTDPYYETLPGLTLNEAAAVDLYAQFTREDRYAGEYPPDDTGSDGLTAGKVCKARGYIAGYQHTFNLNDALLALGKTPFITGINWYDSFDLPDANGLVTITPNAAVRGGHEVEACGLNVPSRRIDFWNSWGKGYGVGGVFSMSWDDYGRLLGEQGDVTIFVSNTSPPLPAPVDRDAVLAAALRRGRFLTRRHVGDNERAAQACRNWLGS